MAERLGKGIKRYFKDNLGILCALAVMIIFLYFYPKDARDLPHPAQHL